MGERRSTTDRTEKPSKAEGGRERGLGPKGAEAERQKPSKADGGREEGLSREETERRARREGQPEEEPTDG